MWLFNLLLTLYLFTGVVLGIAVIRRGVRTDQIRDKNHVTKLFFTLVFLWIVFLLGGLFKVFTEWLMRKEDHET